MVNNRKIATMTDMFLIIPPDPLVYHAEGKFGMRAMRPFTAIFSGNAFHI
jgi:hypothetical protein